MIVIHGTPEELMKKSAEIRSLKSAHDELIGRLASLIFGLSENISEVQDTVAESFKDMHLTFSNFSKKLEDYALFIEFCAREVQDSGQRVIPSTRNWPDVEI